MKGGRRHRHHRQIDEAGDGHGDGHIDPGGMQPLADRALILRVLGQRRVQVDDVGHHGGTEHPSGQIDGLAVGQTGEDSPFQQAGQMGAGEDQLDDVGRRNKQQQTAHHELQRFLAAGLQHQDPPGDHGGDTGSLQQGHAKQQLEADGGADKFGEIGGHGDDLGLHPVGPDRRFRQSVADMLSQILAGDDAEFGREGLHHHGHQVGPHHHPEQLVTKGRAGLNIGGEVARIYVANGSDKGGPEQGQFEFAAWNRCSQCGLHGITLHQDMERE